MAETEDFYRFLGKRVDEARRRRGLTQTALGKRLTPPQTRASISNIEQGNQRVLAHTLAQLASALGVPVSELIPPAEMEPSIDVARTLAENLQVSQKDLRKLIAQLQPKRIQKP